MREEAHVFKIGPGTAGILPLAAQPWTFFLHAATCLNTTLANMDAARGPVLPGPNDGRSRSPWKRMYGRHMVASINQLADSALTMRSFSDISRTDVFDRGPGTPDVILHYGRRPGSRPRSSSLLSGKSTPPDVPAVR